jgi:hypothetical protein
MIFSTVVAVMVGNSNCDRDSDSAAGWYDGPYPTKVVAGGKWTVIATVHCEPACTGVNHSVLA